MITISITTTYRLIYTLSIDSNYGVTKCGKLFNIKRNKELKRVLNGSSVGYWINKKFYTLANLRKYLIKIEETKSPF